MKVPPASNCLSEVSHEHKREEYDTKDLRSLNNKQPELDCNSDDDVTWDEECSSDRSEGTEDGITSEDAMKHCESVLDDSISSSDSFEDTTYSEDEKIALSCLFDLLSIVGVTEAEEATLGKVGDEPKFEWGVLNEQERQNATKQEPGRVPERRSIFDDAMYESIQANSASEETEMMIQFAQSILECDDYSESKGKINRCRSVPGTCSKPVKSVLKRSDSSKQMKRNVSFGNLSIRGYTVELSDHPDCSRGPPVQLGWDWLYTTQVSVDQYEETRLPRSSGKNLLLPDPVRRHLLLEQAGYSKRDLQYAVEEVQRVKRERRSTDTGVRENKSHKADVMAIVKKSLLNFFTGGDSRRRRY